MQIVQLSGGLGNQLFQYAYYLQLNKLDSETYLDDITRYMDGLERNCQLGFTGAAYKPAKWEDILRLRDRDRHLHNWLRRRITGSRDVERFEGDKLTENGYWMGYWQNGGNYDSIETELRNNIFGQGFTDEVINCDAKSTIDNTLSVGVHIRRGDYLNPNVLDVYGGICTDEYYRTAMDTMRGKYPGCTFFVFSNDAEWVKENYAAADVVVMEGNDEEHGYRDMYLMSRCKHDIIANSSFSWWAAWLNANSEKCVIGPSIWIHREGFEDIYKGLNITRITPGGDLAYDEGNE